MPIAIFEAAIGLAAGVETMNDVDANGHVARWPQATQLPRLAECLHPTHRTLRLFLSYAEANSVRVSFKSRLRSDRVAVSPLRRIEGGWSFSMCERCLVAADDVSAQDIA